MNRRVVSTLGLIAIMGGLFGVGVASVSGQCLANEIQKLTAADATMGDLFGTSVRVLDDIAVVGAAWANVEPFGFTGGAAYIYRKDPITNQWLLEQKIFASDASSWDNFALSVAINPIDPNVIIVGAWADDDADDCCDCAVCESGSAYIFRFDSDLGQWFQEQKLTASDADSQDRFGWSVSIWGDVAMIGARLDDDPDPDTGSVYVFRYDPLTETWQEQQKLIPSDWEFSGRFGSSVSLEGDWAVIGAPSHHEQASGVGAAYIFRFDPKMERWEEQQKLQASDGAASNVFGASVSLSGYTALIGATFGDAPGMSNTGAAYILTYDGEQWTEQQKLTASDGNTFDRFGRSVSLKGDLALIGAQLDDDYANGSGSAYIFTLDGSEWNETAKLRYEEVQNVFAFGGSVSTDGEHAIVGANITTVDEHAEAGAAYIYGGLFDCNKNGELDLCDIADEFSSDENNNGIPDECERPQCPWDLDDNAIVGASDVLALLASWGRCKGCPADFDDNGFVGASDILALLANWGLCP